MKPQKQLGIRAKDVRGVGNCKWIPFEDGQTFDLGGRTVTAKSVSGHTAGSVVFLDDKSKIMLTGDDVCVSLWLYLPYCSSVEQWLAGAKTILELSYEYTPYSGHIVSRQTSEMLAKLVQCGEEILVNQPKNAKLLRFKIYPKFSATEPYIIYRKGNVHQKKNAIRQMDTKSN